MRRPVTPPTPPEETPPEAAELPEQAGEQDKTGAASPDPDFPPLPFIQRGSWAGRWRRLSRLPVTLMIASLLLGLGIVQLTFQLGNTAYRSLTWRQETRQTKARVAALQQDVNILRDAEKAAQDPAYLEELARCQGYVGHNENVVVATTAPTTPGENCQAVRLP